MQKFETKNENEHFNLNGSSGDSPPERLSINHPFNQVQTTADHINTYFYQNLFSTTFPKIFKNVELVFPLEWVNAKVRLWFKIDINSFAVFESNSSLTSNLTRFQTPQHEWLNTSNCCGFQRCHIRNLIATSTSINSRFNDSRDTLKFIRFYLRICTFIVHFRCVWYIIQMVYSFINYLQWHN